jgi:hypothetical protein
MFCPQGLLSQQSEGSALARSTIPTTHVASIVMPVDSFLQLVLALRDGNKAAFAVLTRLNSTSYGKQQRRLP